MYGGEIVIALLNKNGVDNEGKSLDWISILPLMNIDISWVFIYKYNDTNLHTLLSNENVIS